MAHGLQHGGKTPASWLSCLGLNSTLFAEQLEKCNEDNYFKSSMAAQSSTMALRRTHDMRHIGNKIMHGTYLKVVVLFDRFPELLQVLSCEVA